jgi:hypothetical protein
VKFLYETGARPLAWSGAVGHCGPPLGNSGQVLFEFVQRHSNRSKFLHRCGQQRNVWGPVRPLAKQPSTELRSVKYEGIASSSRTAHANYSLRRNQSFARCTQFRASRHPDADGSIWVGREGDRILICTGEGSLKAKKYRARPACLALHRRFL